MTSSSRPKLRPFIVLATGGSFQATGGPVIDRLEIWFDARWSFDWCTITKIPLRGRSEKVIGFMGIIRRDEGCASHQPANEASQILHCLQQHSSRIVSFAELARECRMSERTLYRKAKQTFGVTPCELNVRIRVQKGVEALIKMRASITAIEFSHGFCDQSSFTRHFLCADGCSAYAISHDAPGLRCGEDHLSDWVRDGHL